MARQLSTDSDYDGRIPSWAAPVGTNEERSVDRLSRRRSLACSDIDVEIIGTRTDGHTYFIIEVTSVIKKWSLARRFSDFLFVDRQLHKNYPRLQLPKLPPKRFLGSSTDAKVVEERREQLETYLKAVVSIPQVWTRNDLALFLDNETNSMMFIWNFERMRRLQDVSLDIVCITIDHTLIIDTFICY